jgi:hypothetical protein
VAFALGDEEVAMSRTMSANAQWALSSAAIAIALAGFVRAFLAVCVVIIGL